MEMLDKAADLLEVRGGGSQQSRSKARSLAYELRDRLDLRYVGERNASDRQGGKGVEVETGGGRTIKVTANPVSSSSAAGRGRSNRPTSTYVFAVEVDGGRRHTVEMLDADFAADELTPKLSGELG